MKKYSKVTKNTIFFFLENVYDFCSPESRPLLKRFFIFRKSYSPQYSEQGIVFM
jgi:hypothetical protein